MLNTNHQHTCDEHGHMTCCSLEVEKIYAKTKAGDLLKPNEKMREHASR
jgi:hypothetical protein